MKFWSRSPVKDNWYEISINLHGKRSKSSFVRVLSELKDLSVVFIILGFLNYFLLQPVLG